MYICEEQNHNNKMENGGSTQNLLKSLNNLSLSYLEINKKASAPCYQVGIHIHTEYYVVSKVVKTELRVLCATSGLL